MNAYAIIPARYASVRFPGKPLALLKGKPIIQHVFENVSASQLFSEVFVATDDMRIAHAVETFGGSFILTASDLPSGTDRVAACTEHLEPDAIIVNVQGDEPLICREPLAKLLNAFEDEGVQMASLMTHLTCLEDLPNPNLVKVVVDSFGNALYFSRSILPYYREPVPNPCYFRHIGVYAFRKFALDRFVALPVGKLEQIEKLEQLRALENGMKIRMVETDYQGLGVDTPEDLERLDGLTV